MRNGKSVFHIRKHDAVLPQALTRLRKQDCPGLMVFEYEFKGGFQN
jgi:hypothetical protein